MAPTVTNYAEIQNDEIEALRSIYMDDFLDHEVKSGAWNKVTNRSFSIKLRSSSAESSDIALELSVSMPNTYPKSVPVLNMQCGAGISQRTKGEVENVVKQKPETLLGTEMIFEIASLLQDVLDRAAQVKEVPALDQERAMQLAANDHLETNVTNLLAGRTESEDEVDNTDAEEAQALELMVQQTKLRSEKRKLKSAKKQLNIETTDGYLKFDRRMVRKGSTGPSEEFDTIMDPIRYRQGPVTKVSKVYTSTELRDVEPHLVLKEARFRTAGRAKHLKGLMLDLEERLNSLSGLKDDPNVLKPLGYTIKRSADEYNEESDEWHVGIVMELTTKGSMQDFLETPTIAVPATFRAWALQLLEGLHFLHRHRISHSCIHVGNILLTKSETGNIVAKLADGHFQRALHALHNDQSIRSQGVSLVGWTAPEVTNGSETFLQTDVWDLGICFAQMLFGLSVRRSYPTPRNLIKDLSISPSLRDLLDEIFRSDLRQRATAFDLLPAAFLRNDDTVFAQASSPKATQNGFQYQHSAPDLAPNRRESNTTRAISRYRNDFVEAGRLGRGGFGEVVRSRNKLDGRFYAVKKIKSNSTSTLNDVLSEIMILSQINNPYVVRYYNAWLENALERQADYREHSTSTEGSSVTEDEASHLDQLPSGLDFMSQSGPDVDVLLESDSEEETSPQGVDEAEQMAKHDGDSFFDGQQSQDNSAIKKDHDVSFLHDSIRMTSILYIQMEYCERKTLRDLIGADIHANSLESWRIFHQILEGLVHIHALSIVHRDLKPENIFIDADNDVRIGDFGLARHGDYQLSIKPNSAEEAYTSFTKSIGTAFYIAPEVRSASRGKYNEKADMYSLGIIFFEMCVPMMTAMERVKTLHALREQEHVLPPIFNSAEKSTQGSIILSLVDHEQSHRPSSSQLLASEQVPGEVENDKWTRNVFRNINEASYRKKLLAGLFSKPDELVKNGPRHGNIHQSDFVEPDSFDLYDDMACYARPKPQELTYDMKDRSISADEILFRRLVKNKVSRIFRRHGAVRVDSPAILPFSSFYLTKYDQIAKYLSSNDDFLQLSFDHTLPNARRLAITGDSPRKTYTFGSVYRNVECGAPRSIAEADFDIISYELQDPALREAETIKTIDEIMDEFPSMASLAMCYYINHSVLFNAILAFCKINPSKWAPVKDILGTLQGGHSNWSKVRATLRSPTVGVAATSVEELMRFDFQDPYDKAVPKLRSLLSNAALDYVFGHMRNLTTYLKAYGVSRKVLISPLSSVNESFYRGHISFQCIFDTPKREVFAAGGRYDQLIKAYIQGLMPKSSRGQPRAVGFSFNWERLWRSMARYQKSSAKAKPRRKTNVQALDFKVPSRCEVLVDSSDREILRSTGLEIIQSLWANDISAELSIDTESDEGTSVYNAVNEESRGWTVYIKQDGTLRVRSMVKKEDSEIRATELILWLRSEIRERDRLEGRMIAKSRGSGHQELGPLAGDLDVKILTASSKGKKFNRQSVREEANTAMKDTVNSFLEYPVVAIETRDEIFERICETRLPDLESWKRFIQHSPADDRAYLRKLLECLQDIEKERPSLHGVFIYDFRAKSCIYYGIR